MKFKFIIITLIVINLFGKKGFSQSQNNKYNVSGCDIEIIGDLNGFSLDLKTEKIVDGLEVATIILTRDEEAIPSSFS